MLSFSSRSKKGKNKKEVEEKGLNEFVGLLKDLQEKIRPLLTVENQQRVAKHKSVKFNAKFPYKNEEELRADAQVYTENAIAWVYALLDFIIKEHKDLVKINFSSLITSLLAHPILAYKANNLGLLLQNFDGKDAVTPWAVDKNSDELCRLLAEFYETIIKKSSYIPKQFPRDAMVRLCFDQKTLLEERRLAYKGHNDKQQDIIKFGLADIQSVHQVSELYVNYDPIASRLYRLTNLYSSQSVANPDEAIREIEAATKVLSANQAHLTFAKERSKQYQSSLHKTPLITFTHVSSRIEKYIAQLSDLLLFGYKEIEGFGVKVKAQKNTVRSLFLSLRKQQTGDQDPTFIKCRDFLQQDFYKQVEERCKQLKSEMYLSEFAEFLKQREGLETLFNGLNKDYLEQKQEATKQAASPGIVSNVIEIVTAQDQTPSVTSVEAQSSEEEGFSDIALMPQVEEPEVDADSLFASMTFVAQPALEAPLAVAASNPEIVLFQAESKPPLSSIMITQPVVPLIEIVVEPIVTSPAEAEPIVGTSASSDQPIHLPAAEISPIAQPSTSDSIAYAPPLSATLVTQSTPVAKSQSDSWKWGLVGIGFLVGVGLMATGIGAPIGGTLLGLAVADVLFFSGLIPLVLGICFTIKRILSSCFGSKKEAAESSEQSSKSSSRSSSTTADLMREGYASRTPSVRNLSRVSTEVGSRYDLPTEKRLAPATSSEWSTVVSPTRSP